MKNIRQFFGVGLIVLGCICLLLGFYLHSAARLGSGLLWLWAVSLALILLGVVLVVRRGEPAVRKQQAAFHVPGFTPNYAVKNIALETGTGRLWIRDKELGERLLNQNEVQGWSPKQDGDVWGLEFRTSDTSAPVWFSRIGNTPESVDAWSERITAAYRDRGRG